MAPSELELQVIQERLRLNRKLQQDAIACHYVTMIDVTSQLYALVELRNGFQGVNPAEASERGFDTRAIDELIEQLCCLIETWHKKDFGVELFPGCQSNQKENSNDTETSDAASH